MKYLKMLGLAAVAAMALMAFGAGTASATKLCTDSKCTSHLASGSTIEASLIGGTAILETTGGTTLDTCTGGGVSGTTSATEGTPLSGNISSLTWSNCTRTTHTLTNGSLQIEKGAGNDGAVTATNTRVTVNTIFGSCVYGPEGTLSLGTMNGGKPAKLEINALVPRISGPCPSEARWTATYQVTNHTELYVG